MQHSNIIHRARLRQLALFACVMIALLASTSVSARARWQLRPVISGTPPTTDVAGQAYSFTPTAKGPSGYTLTFSISGKPAWASFNTATGQLAGTPTTASIGSFANIVIGVSDGVASASLAPFTITVSAPSNTPPTISGTPSTAVTAGTVYTFTPKASDTDGDTLSFSVQNMPAWATFSIATGTLSGTPATANVGTYSNIVISVSDGHSSASLAPFSIDVSQPATSGTATLNWTAPVTNTDGSALTDLAGYHIYYGTSPSALSTAIDVANPGTTTYTVSGLASGTWYFAVNAYTTSGLESSLSNNSSKSIP
jgi:hypothetical protein